MITLRLNIGHLIALVLAIVLVLWLLLGSNQVEESFNEPQVNIEKGLVFQVDQLSGKWVEPIIEVSAKTAASQVAQLVSSIDAHVATIIKEKGESVKKDELIMTLTKRYWPDRMLEAKARLKQTQLEYNSARTLFSKKLLSETQLAQSVTQLESAKAKTKEIQLKLDATQVRAPFSGVLEDRYLEVSERVKENQLLAVLLSFSPYLLVGHVSEKDSVFIQKGDKAQAKLSSGQWLSGVVEYVSSQALEGTGMFRVELSVTEKTEAIKAGLSAVITFKKPKQWAHRVSGALLVLNDRGQLGLKGLNQTNQVVFHPVELFDNDEAGVWVTGLEKNPMIITKGAGFAKVGEVIDAVISNAKSVMK